MNALDDVRGAAGLIHPHMADSYDMVVSLSDLGYLVTPEKLNLAAVTIPVFHILLRFS